MYESEFQRKLKKEIKKQFPGCYILKTDPGDIQGMPDLLILHGSTWAALEVKKSKDAPHRPNQDYHVETLNKMGYATFIFPENKEVILNELSNVFSRPERTCSIQS